ncbi:MAG: biopolymer transporter ExbD [Leptospiraceae bacterium]|nr:biopolymer transporter ExbD [Leptospiraceae bacterium]
MLSLRKRRKPPGIPLSAMGDIAFLLLVFYMATTMVTDQKPRDIAVPELDSRAQNSPYPIVMYLDQDLASRGQVFVFNQEIPLETLAGELQARAASAPGGGSRFFLNIEKDLPYRHLHRVMQLLKEAQVRQLVITTRPGSQGASGPDTTAGDEQH